MADVIPSNGDQPGDGSPEGQVEKMLAMGDGSGTPTGDKPEGDQVATRPDNVPEKFWDAEKGVVNTEALLKSQADAEAALRQGTKPEGDQTDEEKAAAEAAAAESAQDQPQVVANASAEWSEKGELSEATLTALEGVGLSRDMVNDYIAGQQAIIGNLQTAAYGPFEGADGYNEAANWAANNLDDDTIKALDVQLTSTNPAIVTQGAKALQAKFAAEADIEPDTIRGNSNGSAAGGVYTSSREMMKDMSSAKYRTSAAFRQEVADKLSRSNL